jgi:hypothetical protein
MDIKQFLSESINEIVDGVVLAQEKTRSKGAIVNPSGLNFKSEAFPMFNIDDNSATAVIDFDLAITISEDKKSETKLNVSAGIFGIGAKGDVGGGSSEKESNIHRLKFKIPVHLPVQKAK